MPSSGVRLANQPPYTENQDRPNKEVVNPDCEKAVLRNKGTSQTRPICDATRHEISTPTPNLPSLCSALFSINKWKGDLSLFFKPKVFLKVLEKEIEE